MALFDALIDDVAGRFGLGGNAVSLVREALTLILGSHGGVNGFLKQLKDGGLASDVTSWLGHANAAGRLWWRAASPSGHSSPAGTAPDIGRSRAGSQRSVGDERSGTTPRSSAGVKHQWADHHSGSASSLPAADLCCGQGSRAGIARCVKWSAYTSGAGAA